MQLITLLSAASAMVATTSATNLRSAVNLNKECDTAKPYARVINRCDYDVHLWSVYKGDGCPEDGMVTLKTGEIYNENYTPPKDDVGVSIKISKTKECKGVDITQLEYYLETSKPNFQYNFLDVSYVDCLGGDCPARKDGYYLKAGSQDGINIASSSNTFCPILACHDEASCDQVSYVLPDDVQTKTCHLDQSVDFYMCGGEAPSGDYGSSPSEPESSAEPSTSSSKLAEYSAAKPTSSSASYEDSYTADIEVAAAAVTPAPEKQDPKPYHKLTKTVYVTAVEYVNAKRHAHAHDHVRRHQPFHA